MDEFSRPLIDDEAADQKLVDAKEMERWEAKKEITIELIVDGQSLVRKFRADEVAHIDWNPIINDMADTIVHGNEPI